MSRARFPVPRARRVAINQAAMDMSTLAFMGLGGPELLVVLVIVLVLFGASKIPQMMKGMGQGIKEFKKGLKEDDDTKKDETVESKPDSGRAGGNGHPA